MKIQISQNSKISIFENGMSSYWDEFLSQKIMKWMYSKVFSIPIIIPHIFKTFDKKHKSQAGSTGERSENRNSQVVSNVERSEKHRTRVFVHQETSAGVGK